MSEAFGEGISFERWVTVRAWIDAGTDAQLALARFGVSQDAHDAADRHFITELSHEAARGEHDLRDRFTAIYEVAWTAPEAPAMPDDDDEGPTVPRSLAPMAAQEVFGAAPSPSPAPVRARVDVTERIDVRAFGADLANEPSELSRRILPFGFAAPPMEDPDEVSTVIAPPPRALLEQLARTVDESEITALPQSSRTVVGAGPMTLEQFASLTRGLRSGEPRAEVLSRHHLTEAGIVAPMLVWRERLRKDRALWQRFRELVERDVDAG